MGKKSMNNGSEAGTVCGFKDSPFAALAGLSGLSEAPAAPAKTEGQVEKTAHESVRPKARGRVVLRRETKHRGGKAVIIAAVFGAIDGFDPGATEELARHLKQQLGCGGTVEERGSDREIVLQGDCAAKVAELLRARGFRVDGVTS